MNGSLKALLDQLPQVGKIQWIGVRSPHSKSLAGKVEKGPMHIVDAVQARCDQGLVGDRYSGKSGNRHVTLIQWEHLDVIASLLGRNSIAPELLRRNIAVTGINLLALKNKRFHIGSSTILEYTGLCEPCSAMETTFGAGGYNAIRGHGGITARVIESGIIRIGDDVRIQKKENQP